MKKRYTHRVIIENVNPVVNRGDHPIKRVVGEAVRVTAGLITDGHQGMVADILWKKMGAKQWKREAFSFVENDVWEGSFTPLEVGHYEYTIEAWVDPFLTWQGVLHRILDSEQHLNSEIPVGISLIESMLECASEHDTAYLTGLLQDLATATVKEQVAHLLNDDLKKLSRYYLKGESVSTYRAVLPLEVTRERALFSSWYEMFPRSFASESKKKHASFNDAIARLPYIADMGFDVLYLPPIHPIGVSYRKGQNNALKASKDEPGSPWAIGSKEGGHKSVNPSLGTMADFEVFIEKASELGIEIALDLAFQCSPDHPYVKQHPEWFRWRPDGTVQYAENPPKKYQDIVPFEFDSPSWKELWDELKDVVLFWVAKGVRIFRVDNPHTKPFSFWEWLIAEVKQVDSSVIFLAEAFARPSIMKYLAKIGFDQSYTYFSWRNSKHELVEYVSELTKSEMREYFRPNFWPNTPDILPTMLQHGGRPAFIVRFVLAATLSSNYGIYGPAYELCVGEGIEGSEEYLFSEKYEVKYWDLEKEISIAEVIAMVNRIRHQYTAFQTTWNIQFVETENENLIAYLKCDKEGNFLVVVNLDVHHTQAGMVNLPLHILGIDDNASFIVQDLLTDDRYVWHGTRNYVELSPHHVPAHIFNIHSNVIREKNFDYFV